jgi:hypothetical protein
MTTGLQWKLHSLTRMLLRAFVIFTRQLTIFDSTPRKALGMSGYTVSGHPMYVFLYCFMVDFGIWAKAVFLCHTYRATLNTTFGNETWNHLTIVLELSQLGRLPSLV